MSFFDDDFYSTKVPLWKRKSRSPFRRRRNDWFGIALISLAIGMLIGAGALSLTIRGGKDAGSGNGTSSSVVAVSAIEEARQNLDDMVVKAADTVKPAVVSVITKTSQPNNGGAVETGLGSGVIFHKAKGKVHIITNQHVVQDFQEAEVVLGNGERKKATILGRDVITDLAVLEVDDEHIDQVAAFGDSDSLKAGETAIAIGNPLGIGFSPTITVGVISSPDRTIPVSLGKDGIMDWEVDVIQTDAAINQGNSGGALVNLKGEVIGINSLKVADMGVEGLGFAIPINQVKPIIDSLIDYGKVKRPFMGVTTQDLAPYLGSEGIDVLKLPDDVKTGIIVLDASGPAADAKLKSQDVIVALDDKPVGSTLELRKYIYNHKEVGDKVKVTFYRGGKKMSESLLLGERKEK